MRWCEDKRRHGSEPEAQRALSEMKRDHPKQGLTRVYFCGYCWGWHLTGRGRVRKRPSTRKYRPEMTLPVHEEQYRLVES